MLVDDDARAGMASPAFDADGQVPTADLSGYSVDELLADAGTPFTVDGIDSSVELRAVATPFGDRRALVMVHSLASIDDTVASLTRTFVLIAGPALVISLVSVAIVGRAATRPVEDMIDLAHAIGEGEIEPAGPTASNSTEVGRLAGALNAMLERLEQAFDAKDASERQMREFLSDASHELRNPLTSIRAHAEMYPQPGVRAVGCHGLRRRASRPKRCGWGGRRRPPAPGPPRSGHRARGCRGGLVSLVEQSVEAARSSIPADIAARRPAGSRSSSWVTATAFVRRSTTSSPTCACTGDGRGRHGSIERTRE